MRTFGHWRLRAVSSISFLLLLSLSPDTRAQTIPPGETLKFALILMRHGVRSPTWTNERLDEYSQSPWPKWDVAPGLLTPHGKKVITQFGGYYRQVFALAGLLSKTGCVDAVHVYIYADIDERTAETGRGLADGLLPGCDEQIHSAMDASGEPLFHHSSEAKKSDNLLALSALAGRIGNDPSALFPAYEAQLSLMQTSLSTCVTPPCAVPPKKRLLDQPALLAVGAGDHLVEMKGPLTIGATFAENLQLEFLEGMPDAEVGWGRVNESTMRSLMAIHGASAEIVQRTPYIAKAQAATLLTAMLRTIEQAIQHKAVSGSVGVPEDKVVFLVGHDTNISNVGALLDAHWLVNGYQRDDAAPGGGLVFEVWETLTHEQRIRVYYSVQTPNQMRRSIPPTFSQPSGKAVVFLPGCEHKNHDASCSFDTFRKLIESATQY